MTKLSLNFCKVKAPFDKDVAYVCFRSAEEQSKALETLNGFKWRKKTLQAYVSASNIYSYDSFILLLPFTSYKSTVKSIFS